MSKDPQNLTDEAERDLAAAKAELRGRANQIALDYEERIAQLASLANSLEGGEISPRVVQDRVRQLLGERGGIALSARAGRTQIGMRAPTAPTPAPMSPTRSGPTPTLAGAGLVKAQAEVDSRVVAVMVGQGMRRDEARLELSLLAHLRRGLDLVAADVPADAVLIEGVMEFADLVQGVVVDLDQGGAARAKRLWDYLRELAGQLHAAGASLGDLREQVRRGRTLLEGDKADANKAIEDATALYSKIAPEIERRLPAKERTFLDDMLRV
jgi:hypothetical protein